MQVVLLHFAAPPIVGGVESTIYHHARLLARAGFEVDVIAGRGEAFDPRVDFHHIPEIDSRHPAVIASGEELATGQVTGGFKALRDRLAALLRPLLARTTVCLVHNAMTLHKNLALTAALHRLSTEGFVPLVAWSHDFAWLDPLYTPTLHPGYPWDLLRTPWPGVRYVAVSSHRQRMLAELLGLSEEEIQVITPGVDAIEFLSLPPLARELVERLNLLRAEPLLLLPARITRRKNIEFALRVTAALKRHRPSVSLLITGPPGPHNPRNQAYLASLHGLCNELGISESVHFLYEQGPGGDPLHLADDEVAGLYRIADLLFFPSRSEGFGIPVLEAGLARLPVFASAIEPIQESVGDLAHLFDPDGDPQQVADAILAHLVTDRTYQLKQKVLKRYTWQAILKDQVIPLIQDIAGVREKD